MRKWKIFYFNGNLAWGLVKSRQDWSKIVEEYKKCGKITTKALKTAKSCQSLFLNSEVPRFGFYSEYRDMPTLGQWADQNNINLETAFWPRLITNIKFALRVLSKYLKKYFNF